MSCNSPGSSSGWRGPRCLLASCRWFLPRWVLIRVVPPPLGALAGSAAFASRRRSASLHRLALSKNSDHNPPPYQGYSFQRKLLASIQIVVVDRCTQNGPAVKSSRAMAWMMASDQGATCCTSRRFLRNDLDRFVPAFVPGQRHRSEMKSDSAADRHIDYDQVCDGARRRSPNPRF